MVRSSLACGLQKCLGQLWGNDDFSDFCVIVEDKKYQCHRFILRACSKFFDGLLRSEMTENLQGCTNLPSITADIFDIIMNSVYRGIDGMTQKNVVSVWKAVHQLQIDYLIKECEDFALRTLSLENYLEYYTCAKLLQSEKVLKSSHNFMLNNFNHFSDTETFLDLTAEELYMIVKSYSLNIKSEELVLTSILRWVFHVPTFSSGSEILVSDNSKAKQRLSVGKDENDNKEKDLTDDSAVNKSDSTAANGTEDMISTDNQQTSQVGWNTEDTVSIDKQQVKNVNTRDFEESNDMSTSNVVTKVSTKGDYDCKDKDRVMELAKLLRVARLCFLRPEYLQYLMNHPVISTNKEALAELLSAYFYQQKAHQDYWPPTAVHRACSDMTHAMVYIDGQKKYCKVYSLDNDSTHILCELPKGYSDQLSKVSLGISDQMLFIRETLLLDVDWISHIYIWGKFLGWTKCTVAMDGFLEKLLPHGQQFYMIYSNAEKDYQIHLGKIMFGTLRTEHFTHAAVSCKRYILTIVKKKTNMATVTCYDTVTKEITRLQDWDGPPENIISFRCGDNIYILQRNGTLRLVISIDNEDNIDKSNEGKDKVLFQLVGRLWDFDWEPYGAVVYKDELIIFGSQTYHSVTWVTSVPDNSDFKTIKIIQIDSLSECLPMIVPKAWLK